MLMEALPPGQRSRVGPFHGSADALAIAELAGSVRPLLVMTASAADAQRLLEEIPWFDPALKVHLLPDWETLPYDSFSPHHDLVSERLATLYQIMQQAFDVALVPVTTALYRLPPVEYLAGTHLLLQAGRKLAADELRRQLTLAGYTHVTQVLSPGEFSFRGGLIDLFPMGSALPYRLDLFDDEIESIRSFDVDTQRSIYKVQRSAAAAGARISARRGRARRASAATSASTSRAIRRAQRHLQGREQRHRAGRHRVLPAAVLRRRPRSSPTTCRRTPRWCCTAKCSRRSSSSGATRRRATTCCAATAAIRCCRRANCSCPRTSSSARSSRYARIEIDAVQVSESEVSEFKRDEPEASTPEPSSLNPRPRHRDGGAAAAGGRPPRRQSAAPAAARSSSEFDGRVLMLAESLGRRETMLEYLRRVRSQAGDLRRLRAHSRLPASALMLGVGAARLRLHARRAPASRSSPRTSSMRRRCATAAQREAQRKTTSRGHAARPVGGQDRRPGGARAARHRPLPRLAEPWTSAKARPNS